MITSPVVKAVVDRVALSASNIVAVTPLEAYCLVSSEDATSIFDRETRLDKIKRGYIGFMYGKQLFVTWPLMGTIEVVEASNDAN